LATAAGVAFATMLPQAGPTPVYGQLLGGITVAYAPLVGWAILLVAVALLAFAIVRARRIETFPWTDVLRGAGAALFAVVGGCAVLHSPGAPRARTSGSSSSGSCWRR